MRGLRSSSSLSICFPPRKTTMATSKSFLSVASGIWNALPNHLSSIPTLLAFRRALKHHLFLLAYPDSNAKCGRIKPAQCITLRDTAPTTAIAPPGNTMPPIWRCSIWAPTISWAIHFAQATYWHMCKSCVTYLLSSSPELTLLKMFPWIDSFLMVTKHQISKMGSVTNSDWTKNVFIAVKKWC